MARTRLRSWIGLLLALAVGAGAGSLAYVVVNRDDRPAVDHLAGGMPVVRGAAQGPGAPLAVGFEVADGTRLVGDVLPNAYWDSGADQRASQALLLLDAPGRDALDAYLAQAARLGLRRVGDRSEPCGMEVGDLVCRATVGGSDVLVSFELRQGPRRDDRPPQSAMMMRVTPSDPDGDGSDVGEPPAPTAGPRGEVPGGWPALPGTGGEFWATKRVSSSFEVVEGTHLVATPAVLLDVTWIVLEVTGDVEDALRGYQDQDPGDDGAIESDERADGTVITWTCWTPGSICAWAVERPGRPTWLVIEANPLS